MENAVWHLFPRPFGINLLNMVNTAAITGNVSDTRNLFNTTLLVAFVSMGGILFGYDVSDVAFGGR